MKYLAPFVLGALLLSLSASCEQITEPESEFLQSGEYLVFGTYFGFCRGEQCIEIFKLENGKLYEDTRDEYPAAFYDTGYQGKFKELSAEDYALAKNLPEAFPEALLEVRDTTIGSPDAADGGGIYVEIRDSEGKPRYWFIDNMEDNLPGYLRPFADSIRQTVQRLSE